MLTWQEYEGAVLEHIRQEFAGAAVEVLGTHEGQEHKVVGRFSRVERQLDVAVHELGNTRPFLVVDAKRHDENLDVKDVECFMGMADDVGAQVAALVAPKGFSAAATNRANAASMHLEVLTLDEALTCRWLPLARRLYPHDWVFHRDLADSLRLLDAGAPHDELMEALGAVAYEEWLACVSYALANHSRYARGFLLALAEDHWDDGWRYNAVQLLLEHGHLDEASRTRLASAERDPEVLELLRS